MRPKIRYTNPFDKETELAAHFIEAAREHGWAAYPETADFDVLLVATPMVQGHFEEGDQIGVQAKLVPNLEVLYQALPRHPKMPGPKYYAVLVPRATESFSALARRLHIKVFEATQKHWSVVQGRRGPVEWRQGPVGAFLDPPSSWRAHEHKKACWVPPCEVDIPAGVAGPQQLTPWKFKAVKLGLHGAAKGYLTTHDFKVFDVSMTRWIKMRWLRPGAWVVEDGRRRKAYHLVDERLPPHLKFPEVAAALREAEYQRWIEEGDKP